MKRPYKIRSKTPACHRCHPETCSPIDCRTIYIVTLGQRELAEFYTKCAAEQWCHNTGRNYEFIGQAQ